MEGEGGGGGNPPETPSLKREKKAPFQVMKVEKKEIENRPSPGEKGGTRLGKKCVKGGRPYQQRMGVVIRYYGSLKRIQ